jgi:hypothetical protein
MTGVERTRQMEFTQTCCGQSNLQNRRVRVTRHAHADRKSTQIDKSNYLDKRDNLTTILKIFCCGLRPEALFNDYIDRRNAYFFVAIDGMMPSGRFLFLEEKFYV